MANAIYSWPKNLGDSQSPYQDYIIFKAVKKTYYNDPNGKSKPIDFIEGHIALPIPDSIEFVDGMKWSAEDSSITAKDVSKLKNLFVNPSTKDASNISNIADGLIPEYLFENAAKLQKFGSKNAITQRTYNAILNPYTDQIFNGLELRSFTFNWKLVPRNQEEQFQIHNIIKLFREFSLPEIQNDSDIGFLIEDPEKFKNLQGRRTSGVANTSETYITIDNVKYKIPYKESLKDMQARMLERLNTNPIEQWFNDLGNKSSESTPESDNPEKITIDTNERWLSIPHYWKIKFCNKTDRIKSIPKMKDCIISNINVNYTPDGQWSTHYYNQDDELKGPVPVAYNLSINLGETEIVTSSDTRNGY